LVEYFLKYNSVDSVLSGKDNQEVEDEIYRNFEAIKITNRIEWNSEIQEQRQRARSERQAANYERHKKWLRERYARMDELERRELKEKRKRYQEADTIRQQERRARIAREEPEKILEEREKQRKRMQKLRAKRKAEKK